MIRRTAKTYLELKPKLRKAMGWPDRRTFTVEERRQIEECWTFSVDTRRGLIVATYTKRSR